MKTKMSKIFLGFMIAMGLSLTSCSKDGNGGNGNDTGNDESGYFSLKIKTGTLTKAVSAGDMDAADEQKINAIRVVLYDKNTDKVAYSWNFNTTEGPDDNNLFKNSDPNYITIAQEVKKQDYNLLVIVNPTDDVINATKNKGQDYSLYAEAKEETVENLTRNNSRNDWSFMMSNFAGLVNVSADNDIFGTKEEAHADPVTVYVERAVAKIMVFQGANFESDQLNSNFSATLTGWAVDVKNQKTFWTRRQAKMLSGDNGNQITESGDPLDRKYMYAIDPNYEDFHTYSFPFLEATEFDYISDANNVIDDEWEYVLENTMAADDQYQNVTTCVVIKAQYTPAAPSFDSKDYSIADEGGSYYVYNNYFIFTPAQIQKIHSNAYTGWADIVALNPALKDLQDFLKNNATETVFNNYAPLASIKYGNLQFNADGVNYYKIPIRHFGDGIQDKPMDYGRYGVVRNNVYKITINSISGPGSVVIPGGPDDPDVVEEPKPDDAAKGFVSVDIEILPWFERTQVVDL